jgi:uncharacterized protein (DUF2344 family)
MARLLSRPDFEFKYSGVFLPDHLISTLGAAALEITSSSHLALHELTVLSLHGAIPGFLASSVKNAAPTLVSRLNWRS